MRQYMSMLFTVSSLFFGWAGNSRAEADDRGSIYLDKAKALLSVGDPAPPLAVQEFVKGDPVKSFEKGKTYFVEFWAINCPPCRACIPHVAKLQKKYKDVIFIGVDVLYFKGDNPADIKPFAEKMGDKMDYRVAVDALSKERRRNLGGEQVQAGRMQKTWLHAAGVYGIPWAFIVDGDGKIAWIGHPGFIVDDPAPLEKIIAGKWDLAAAAERYKKQMAARLEKKESQANLTEKLNKIKGKVRKSGEPKKVEASFDQAVADNPKLEAELRALKWRVLVELAGDDPKKKVAILDRAIADNPKAGYEWEKFLVLIRYLDETDQALNCGRHLLEVRYDANRGGQRNAVELINIAWVLIGSNDSNPDAEALAAQAKVKANPKLVHLALQAALRADASIKGVDDDYLASEIADTLAEAYFLSGDVAKAVETQERAVKLAVGTPAANEPGLKKRLEQYQEAAKNQNMPR